MKMIKKYNEFMKSVNESEGVKKFTFENGNESFEANVLNSELEITFEEAKRILKSGKFNDDKWGSIIGSYEGKDDEDPQWFYIDDITDEGEFENIEDYTHYFIIPNEERGTSWNFTSNIEHRNKLNSDNRGLV